MFQRKSKQREINFLKVASPGKFFFVMLHRGKNFRENDPRPSLTETATEIFLENSCVLYGTQIIPLNIVLSRSS